MNSYEIMEREVEIHNRLLQSQIILSNKRYSMGKPPPTTIPAILDMGAYVAEDKQSFRLIKNKYGKLVLEDGSQKTLVNKTLSYFYIT